MLQFFLLLVDQVIGCVTYFLNFWIQISDARKSKIFLFFLVRNFGTRMWILTSSENVILVEKVNHEIYGF
ncbi:uncharacterized protein OCT59_023618 [Rhizophagus irregularis]|uniref:uncharacterized protein n=1 Tax=Rhizophagus irregularis TaxID=588596 RepID=UPI00332554C6|nr:hypothetical protein OCT59_023618 [Rhizophagus irregularis]